MTATLTVYCNGPDCAETLKLASHADGCFDVPQPGWLHVQVDGPGGLQVADYCGWSCYSAHVVAMAMDGGGR